MYRKENRMCMLIGFQGMKERDVFQISFIFQMDAKRYDYATY